jgi:hypothetical protein
MKRTILKIAIITALAASTSVHAFTVNPGTKDTHLMSNGIRLAPGMTIDNGNVYRNRGNSNSQEVTAQFGKHQETAAVIYDKQGTQTGRLPAAAGAGGSFTG